MNKYPERKEGCRVTAVIPNYNGITYLEGCLESLLSGTMVPEVIVVDNGSSDASVSFLEEKYAGHPGVRLIKLAENTGFSHAVNVGIKAADTEYIFLLNNDTVTEPDCVANLQRAMDASPKFFSAAAKLINMKFPEKLDAAGDFYNALGWAFARGKDKAVSTYHKQERIFSACAAAALYRKSILEEIGLFDEAHFAYLEDVDVGYRANLAGYQNIYVPDGVVLHAGSAVSGSRHNAFKVDLSARNSIYLIYKNMPILQVLLNLPFLLAGFLIKSLFFIKKGLGKVYFIGLKKGIELSFSPEGRRKKVPFRIKNLKNYVYVQWELWIGLLRRFF